MEWNDLYILQDGMPVLEPDHERWVLWHVEAEPCILLATTFADVVITTSFLPQPEQADNSTLLLFFETHVIASEHTLSHYYRVTRKDERSRLARFLGGFDICRQYETLVEARLGHQQLTEILWTLTMRSCLQQQLVTFEKMWQAERHLRS